MNSVLNQDRKTPDFHANFSERSKPPEKQKNYPRRKPSGVI